MFEEMTQDSLLAGMLAEVPDTTSKIEGTIAHGALAPVSVALAGLYAKLGAIMRIAFLQTAADLEWVARRAWEFGLDPLPATRASGTVQVAGADGAAVAEGQIFLTESGRRYRATAAAEAAGGLAEAHVEAVEAGPAGNIPAGQIVRAAPPIEGAEAVTNEKPIEGGAEAETAEALKSRQQLKARNPILSGNKAHYEYWAREVPGVGGAMCIPLWDGPGTVKVAVIDSAKAPAAAVIVEACAAHIEAVRPIGAAVTVVPAASAPISVAASVLLAEGETLGAVRGRFAEAFAEYVSGLALTGRRVSWAQIGAMLLDAQGVIDYSGLLVNGSSANVAIEDGAVAVPGEVELSEW
jgi:uncharacterized phage protein gp47/JayE